MLLSSLKSIEFSYARAPQEVPVQDLAKLYQSVWPACRSVAVDEIIKKNSFEKSEWVLARHFGCGLVGAGGLSVMDENSRDLRRFREHLFGARRIDFVRGDLEKEIEAYRAKINKPEVEIVVQAFDNPLVRELEIPEPGDVYLYGLTVHPCAEHLGVGTKLAQLRLERAMEIGAHAAFVSCLDDSASPHIYGDKLGFSSILYCRPGWHDGSGVRQMAKKLR